MLTNTYVNKYTFIIILNNFKKKSILVSNAIFSIEFNFSHQLQILDKPHDF